MLQSAKRSFYALGYSVSSNFAVSSQISSNRFFHSSSCQYGPVVAAEGNVSKEALMQLRKRTGYSISKCKQAILQYGDDLEQAEQWLQTTARKEGWDKISKKSGVTATQGLLGMIVSNGLAAIAEVNCQTDFVARNERFRSAVAQITRGIFTDAVRNYRLNNEEISTRWNLSYDRVSEKQLDFGAKLPDLLADTVGQLGEKIAVGGAFIMRVAPDVTLASYVHSRSDQNIVDGVATGHFAALVAFRAPKDSPEIFRTKLGMQLCQHIIGMNPSSIGSPPEPKSTTREEVTAEQGKKSSSDESQLKQETEDEEDDREAQMNAQQTTKLSNETTLLRQDFMLEPDMTVYEFLRQHDTEVIDFVRLERGAITAVHTPSA